MPNEEKAPNDLVGKMLSKMFLSMFSSKEQDITFSFDKLELKLPFTERPIELTGKIVLTLTSKKKKD